MYYFEKEYLTVLIPQLFFLLNKIEFLKSLQKKENKIKFQCTIKCRFYRATCKMKTCEGNLHWQIP